jgi:ADP-heptose:LPS heptosyltransferase
MSQRRKIMVLNLTRMGDIIQSIPFFKRLRMVNPDSEIHTLVEECFADVATFLPGVDRLHRVRLEDLLPALASTREGNLTQATEFYRRWIAGLQAEGFDQVWNLTHTRPSVLLSFLLAGGKGMGVTLDRVGLQTVNAPWLQYFFATNLARPWCQFNLVDIYANCIKGPEWAAGRSIDIPVDPQAQSQFASALTPGSIRIAIHAGASQKGKQWPVQSYRKVAERLLKHPQTEVLLVGGKSDKNLANDFADMPRVHDYLGKTSVPQLAALMKECHLLISNDSGPMHVAAGVGTPVIAVTVGSALGSETAPYGEGHLVVEPDIDCFPCSAHQQCSHPLCAERVSVEAIASLAEWNLNLRKTVPPDDLAGTRVYRTGFSTEDGLLDLERIFGASRCLRDDLSAAVRPAWLAVLDHRPLKPSQQPERIPEALSAEATLALQDCESAIRAAQNLADTASDRNSNLERIQIEAENLRQIESALKLRLMRHGLLMSFQMYLNIARASLQGGSLADQARETVDHYRAVRLLLQSIANTNLESEHILFDSSASRKERHENLTERS